MTTFLHFACVEVKQATYAVEVKAEPEIPALLTDRLPISLFHQLVVQVDRRHRLI